MSSLDFNFFISSINLFKSTNASLLKQPIVPVGKESKDNTFIFNVSALFELYNITFNNFSVK